MTRTRRLDPKLLLASMGIAVGLVLIAAGVRASVTGKEEQALPPEIEAIDPVRNAAQVPSQSRIFVDLITGYEAVLEVDGIELPTISLDELGELTGVSLPEPGEQLTLPPGAVFEPGNVTLTFVPATGAPIEELTPGLHSAKVTYWKVAEGRTKARTFTWTFYVV